MKKMTQSDKGREAEKLGRFIDSLEKDERPDTAAQMAGMRALRRRLEELLSSSGTGKLERFGTGTPQFGVAIAYTLGAMTYEEACEKLSKLSRCEKRAAETELADMKSRAEQAVALVCSPGKPTRITS